MAATPDRIPDATPDMQSTLLDRLRDLVPEAFSDGRFDLNALASLVGASTETSTERYALT